MNDTPPGRRRVLLAALAVGFVGAGTAGVLALRPAPERRPSRLRVGILPDQSAETIQRRFRPLVTYLETALELPCEMVPIDSYARLVDRFAAGEIELAHFGGFTFVQAWQRSAAIPLVTRDVDRHFTTVFLAAAADPRVVLTDFRGAGFSFGPRLSTSGHLAPRHFLARQGIEPEAFFGKVGYSRGHDDTAALVRDRRVEVGAANSVIVDQMFAAGELRSSEVKLIWETPPYMDYVWAVPADLAADLRIRIRDAFLALSPVLPAHAAVLAVMGGSGYLPVSVRDYEELSGTVRALEAAGLDREPQA